MLLFVMREGIHPDVLGFIPEFIDEEDTRPLAEQFNDKYIGGWNPMKGFEVVDKESWAIKYPGDPALQPLAWTTVGKERFFFYPYAFVAIVQEDGSFEVARMD
jgi:hypothetical protein